MARQCMQCGESQSVDARFCPRCGATLLAAPAPVEVDPLIGTVIADRYRLIDRIGRGASGAIYRAEHTTLQRQLAIKILHARHAQDQAAVERFRREATTIGQIDNDHLLQISDFGTTVDHRLFFAMELLEGETLAAVLERDGRVSAERAVKILLQVTDALGMAHSHGYIHRDLRPRNVFLAVRRGERDFVKLLDFGLAKLAQPEVEMRQTALGMTFGDPRYMSPEQASGHTLDARSDVYSLGVVAFEMLTGAAPFEGSGPIDVLQKVLDNPTPKIVATDCPEWLRAVVERALQKRSEDRFVDMKALAEYLRNETAPVIHEAATVPVRPAPSRTLIMETALPASVAAAAVARPQEPSIIVEPSFGTAQGNARSRVDPTPLGFVRPAAGAAEGVAGEVRSPTAARPAEAESSPSVVIEAGYIPARDDPTGPRRTDGEDGWFRDRSAPIVVDDHFGDDPPKKTKGLGLIGGIAVGMSLLAIGTIALWPRHRAASTAAVPVVAAPTPVAAPAPVATLAPIKDAAVSLVTTPAVVARAPKQVPTVAVAPPPNVKPPRPPRLPQKEAKAPRNDSPPKGFSDPFAAAVSSELDTLVKNGKQKLAAGDLAQAQSAFAKAKGLDARNADAYAGLGEVAFEQGDYSTATSQLKQAVKLSPNRARFLVLLGQSYYKSGRAKEAVQEYRRALRIDPSNQEAQRSLELAEKKLAQGG